MTATETERQMDMEVMFASYGELKIIVTLLRTGLRPPQVASFGSPRPNVGEGLGGEGGGEGDTSLLSQLPKLGSG
jgi:hypothetical protein